MGRPVRQHRPCPAPPARLPLRGRLDRRVPGAHIGAVNRLLLVDFNNVAHRAYSIYGTQGFTGPGGEHTALTYGVLSMTLTLIRESGATHVAFAMESKTPTHNRRMIEDFNAGLPPEGRIPEYKAGRKPMDPDMAEQLKMAGAAIVRMGWKWYRADGYEADDILATLARQGVERFGHVFIATSDHDLYGMVSRQITVLAAAGKPKAPAEGEAPKPKSSYLHVTPEVVFEKMGVEPRQIADLRALVGDTSDGYPGCPGIGDKKAPGLLATYGTLDGVYEHVDGLPDSVKAKLIAGEPLARLSRELATLATDAPVVLDPNGGKVGAYDHEAARLYLGGLGLHSIINRLGLPPYEPTAPAISGPAAPAMEELAIEVVPAE